MRIANRQSRIQIAGLSASRLTLLAGLALCLCLWPVQHTGAGEEKADTSQLSRGVVPGVSQSPYVHHVFLHDAWEKRISPTGEYLLPFSTRFSCGHCHEYSKVSTGWHFNAYDPAVPPGRPGEPWVFISRKAGTQLPLSERSWPGTYRPSDVGMSAWDFVLRYGRHLPGGGTGEVAAEKDKDKQPRWLVSGKLEINCMACHSSDKAQDMLVWFGQVQDQNLMWAAAASSGIASVKGSARRMPDMWDPAEPPNEDDAKKAPSTKYDVTKFDTLGRVFFPTDRHMPVARCYYCHSTRQVDPDGPPMWHGDGDVHIEKGLKCTACHRNGLDHKIVRGYDGETVENGGPDTATLTCQGCHMGTQAGVRSPLPPGNRGGRICAPRPTHKGLPPLHFKQLTCTACHSGPQPELQVHRVQTSRLHALEIKGDHRNDDAPPYVVAPVFLVQDNGMIAPHKLMWPSFWGRLKDGKVTPLATDALAKNKDVGEILDAAPATPPQPGAKPLTTEKMTKMLKALGPDPAGEAVYVGGGAIYTLNSAGALTRSENAAAKPYAWPLAHNVRPATRALGAGGCTDCHSKDGPLFHAQVTSETFVEGPAPVKAQYELLEADPFQLKMWELSFVFRPVFVSLCVATSLIVLAVLLRYLLGAVAALSRHWR
ncbi:MAG: hypothetical protein NTW87_18245 [Planctomycetota bacterium]|nr:hypothetical protein [Planctomycetota bacterium]